MPADSGEELQRQGLHVYLVRDDGVRHDGGRVGIDQHHLISFLAQGKAGLGSGIVKLGSLSDDNGPGTDHQDFLDICALRHGQASFIISIN